MKQLLGYALSAIDGEIGRVKGFYFDDKDWAIRYVAADCGNLVPGGKLLVPAWALGKVCGELKLLEVIMTRGTIKNASPPDSVSPFHSIQEVTGFTLEGPDATIGHVEDFLVDDLNWTICFLVIAMCHPSFGKNVLIVPRAVTNTRWTDSTLHVGVTRKEAERSCRAAHRQLSVFDAEPAQTRDTA